MKLIYFLSFINECLVCVCMCWRCCFFTHSEQVLFYSRDNWRKTKILDGFPCEVMAPLKYNFVKCINRLHKHARITCWTIVCFVCVCVSVYHIYLSWYLRRISLSDAHISHSYTRMHTLSGKREWFSKGCGIQVQSRGD